MYTLPRRGSKTTNPPSTSKDAKNPSLLEHHMNRVGYHFREMIVEQARTTMIQNGKSHLAAQALRAGEPEPIPKDQRDIDRQADAVLRDLFPRVPNIDRQEIIQHAFKKVRLPSPSPSVLPLSRRLYTELPCLPSE